MQGSASHKTSLWYYDSAEGVMDGAVITMVKESRAGLLAFRRSLPLLPAVVKHYDPSVRPFMAGWQKGTPL